MSEEQPLRPQGIFWLLHRWAHLYTHLLTHMYTNPHMNTHAHSKAKPHRKCIFLCLALRHLRVDWSTPGPMELPHSLVFIAPKSSSSNVTFSGIALGQGTRLRADYHDSHPEATRKSSHTPSLLCRHLRGHLIQGGPPHLPLLVLVRASS